MDPWPLLRSGDQVEQLVGRALVERANEFRNAELAGLARGVGVTAGQTVALCLGADPVWVQKVGEALLGGE